MKGSKGADQDGKRRGETGPAERQNAPNRSRWLLLIAVIALAGVGGFLLVRSATRPDPPDDVRALHKGLFEPPKKHEALEPVAGTPPAPAPGSGSSVPQPRGEPVSGIMALKKEELAVVQQLVKEFPESADPLFLLGNVYQAHGNTAEAVKRWEQGLRINPNVATVYHAMAWVALEKGQYEKAVELWRKALTLNPRLPDANGSMARALMGLGRTDEAIEALKRDIVVTPSAGLSHFLLGQEYLQLKRYEEAQECYERALSVQPKLTNAYWGLMQVMTRLGDREKAKRYLARFKKLKAEEQQVLKDQTSTFEDVVVVRAAAAQTYAVAGRCYVEGGDVGKAELLLKRGAALDPKNTPCRMELAALYDRLGKSDEAIALYEETRRIEPGNAGACLALGSLYLRAQRTGAAEKALRKAIELAPQLAWGYRELARLYLLLNRNHSEARRLAERAVELESSAPVYDILAWARYATGDRGGALTAIKKAVELDPDNAAYKERYEKLLERD